MRVLVTGGLGFIGSHQAALLLRSGHSVAVVDDLSNSHAAVASRLEQPDMEDPEINIFDIRDSDRLSQMIQAFQPSSVIHFAGKKHVSESVDIPVDYYDVNVGGLLSLIKACRTNGVRQIVFSSSGSVYGETESLPIAETQPHVPTNPYSMTKSVCERILADLCHADPSTSVVALRYFNPAGADPSGILGEWCLGAPSNLLPRLIESAYGQRPTAHIHGDDFNTPDGTGVRDYVHVMDVVEAHMRALDLMDHADEPIGFRAYNVGRGEGVSVRQLIEAVQRASGREFDVQVGPRRAGDVSALYGDTALAAKELSMETYQSLDEICVDAWNFRVRNPDGYEEPQPPDA